MATHLAPRDERRLQKARAAWVEGRAEESLRLYQRLAQRNPNHPSILTELAQCYAKLRRYSQADRLLRQLIDRHSTLGRIMVLVGHTYRLMRWNDQALAAYRLAVRCALPADEEVAVRTEMALACERKNDLTAAQQHVDYLLEHAPGVPLTGLVEGILAGRKGDWSRAESRLRRAVDQGLATPLMNSRARYELGNALDQLARYDDALVAIGNAKSIALPGQQAARRKSNWVARLTSRLTDAVQHHHFEEWASAAEDWFGRPLCLITGHPRSGTTLLEQMLDSHPQIASADESSSLLQTLFEPLVGETEQVPTASQLLLETVADEQVRAYRAAYVQRLERLANDFESDHWLVDKNPESMVMLPVLQRSIPSARVIVVLRDPRDVCLSCYMQFLPATPVSVNFKALESTAAKYARTMNLWLAMRDHLRLPWCEVKYEALVEDPRGSCQAVLDFLGVAWDDRVLQFAEHVRTKVVKSPTYGAVAEPIYSRRVGRWKNYARQMEPCLEILQPFVEAFGYA